MLLEIELFSLFFQVIHASRNTTTDFCMLILYSGTLPNSFISSNSFLVDSRVLTIGIILLLPFLFGCLSFIFLARTSNIMLNSIGESRHPGHIPDLRGKVFNLSLFSMILPVDLSYIIYITLKYILLYPICWEFLPWKVVELH